MDGFTPSMAFLFIGHESRLVAFFIYYKTKYGGGNRMRRRGTLTVLVGVMICFCSLLFIPNMVQSQTTITLKYANFPPAATFPCVQMERWAKEVEKRTNGKVKVQTFPGGTLLPAKNIFDGVISGVADIGNFAMSYQPGRFPVSEAVDQPIGFSSARSASLALYDLIKKYKPKEFETGKNSYPLYLSTCKYHDK